MAFFTLKELQGVGDEDLEYIPDKPDFIDGSSVVTDDYNANKIHTGELPSEQDPRDKVEEDYDNDGECGYPEVVFGPPEVDDMTDLIENTIIGHRVGANPFMWAAEQAGKAGDWAAKKTGINADNLLSGTPPNLGQGYQDYRERGRAKKVEDKYGENYFSYNLFEDPEVIKVMKRHGLSDKEIYDFAVLRERHLSRAKSKNWSGEDEPLKWGQGLGQSWALGNYGTPPALKLDPYQQEIYRRWKPVGQQRYQRMNPEERQLVWKVMQKKYPQFWGNSSSQKQPVPSDQNFGPWTYGPAPKATRSGNTRQPAASKTIRAMRNHVNLIGGLLAMPRTAAVLSQTVDLISAVSELDDGKSLDETTRSALRNTSRNLLMATDHLRGVNNRIANRVAGEIEQLFVNSFYN